MFPKFLPAAVAQLSDATSIALAQQIQQTAIATPLSDRAVTTTYVKQGTGEPPILLLHGFDSSVLEFRRLLPLLVEQSETWAVDLLSFGFTDRRPDLPVTPAAIKAHLYAFWQTQINRPVTLVGASMGGAVAIDFALTHPDCVAQLVLLDSAGFAQGPDLSRLMVPPLGLLATAFLRNANVRRRISESAYCDRTLNTPDAQLCASLHVKQPGWSQATIAFTRSGGYSNAFGDRIAQISQPTLIVWGKADRILGTDDAERFANAIATNQLVWIEQCGHVPHLEKPQQVAAAIQAFRASLPTRTSTG